VAESDGVHRDAGQPLIWEGGKKGKKSVTLALHEEKKGEEKGLCGYWSKRSAIPD